MAAGNSTNPPQPIAKAFALTVLLALVALALLRHLFGSIRVDAGVH